MTISEIETYAAEHMERMERMVTEVADTNFHLIKMASTFSTEDVLKSAIKAAVYAGMNAMKTIESELNQKYK